jgi:hypothetical protein
MTSNDLTPQTAQKIDELLRFADKNGISASVVSTRRSCAEQNAIYAGGAGVVTEARGCQSWHVWGRAADLHIDGPSSGYAVLGAEWKRMGGKWGGDFSFGDLGHFEWHPGLTIEDVCPDQSYCPDPNAQWPEDRPFFTRPGVQLTGGLVLAGLGLFLANRLRTGYALF